MDHRATGPLPAASCCPLNSKRQSPLLLAVARPSKRTVAMATALALKCHNITTPTNLFSSFLLPKQKLLSVIVFRVGKLNLVL